VLNQAAMKRIIVPGLPHHIIQRGLKGQKTFLAQEDYASYIRIMAESCHLNDVEIWAYCLMPDHAHLIAIPWETKALSRCFRTAHSRYTKYINRRIGRSGQFWQGQYSSHLLDENYLISCARYIEINPVKRDYIDQAKKWQWSSARAHITQNDDDLVLVSPLLERVKADWQDFLAETRPREEADLFYRHEKSGLPLGTDHFIAMVEERCG
jgi:putative transposase